MKTPIGMIAGIAFAAGASMVAGKTATAETPAEFYKDNVLIAILGAGPGGGYDLYARTVMSYLVKRISKKKRAINFGLVTTKDLAKAKAKQRKAFSGLMALGRSKGETVLLIVRNKAPKKVSKNDYAAAVAEFVRVLKSAKSARMVKQQWSGYGPSSGAAEFKAAGVKLHKAAIM